MAERGVSPRSKTPLSARCPRGLAAPPSVAGAAITPAETFRTSCVGHGARIDNVVVAARAAGFGPAAMAPPSPPGFTSAVALESGSGPARQALVVSIGRSAVSKALPDEVPASACAVTDVGRLGRPRLRARMDRPDAAVRCRAHGALQLRRRRPYPARSLAHRRDVRRGRRRTDERCGSDTLAPHRYPPAWGRCVPAGGAVYRGARGVSGCCDVDVTLRAGEGGPCPARQRRRSLPRT